MGTRADFYIGRGKDAEWLGSIAWDGYPEGLPELNEADSEDSFRAIVRSLAERDDFTEVGQGWPWPWEDSRTTDYAYAYDGGLWFTCFGYAPWRRWGTPEPEEYSGGGGTKLDFPNMSRDSQPTLGPRSGLIVVTNRGIE